MKISEIMPEEYDEMISLFEKDFYFMTTYPEYTPLCELKRYLEGCEKSYKVLDNRKIIGLAFLYTFIPEYSFIKFKVKPGYLKLHDYAQLMKNFINLVVDEQPDIKRMDTEVFSFEEEEIHVLEELGFTREVCKRNEIFMNNRFWDTYIYSLIGEEIEALIIA